MNDTPLGPPELISPDHDLTQFDCGTSDLNDWLRKRALRNHEDGASRTYVVCDGREVVGYYCLAAGGISNHDSPGRVRRNMPQMIPVMVIGRLAVDRRWQGHGLGRRLLRNALKHTLRIAENVGIRAILVHAISEDARKFYLQCGFQPSPTEPMTLLVTLADARKALL